MGEEGGEGGREMERWKGEEGGVGRRRTKLGGREDRMDGE